LTQTNPQLIMTKKKTIKAVKFYEITQNNSGGSWDIDENLCHRLFIEADSEDEALGKAEGLGVYFDGCSDGTDCSCCGDRWSRHADEIVLPYRYGTFSLEDVMDRATRHKIGYAQTTWRFLGTHEPEPDKYDLIFPTVESYAQYLASEYRATTPEARIFYKNGKVKEIK
jgi:hypothetical protein